MQPRRIDGIYKRDIPRRSPERRLVVPARPTEAPAVAPTIVQMTDIRRVGAAAPADPPAALTPTAAAELKIPPTSTQESAKTSKRPRQRGPIVRLTGRLKRSRDHSLRIPDLSEPSRRSQLVSSALAALGVGIVVGAALLGWQTWQTNIHAKEVFSQPAVETDPTDHSAPSAANEAVPSEAPVADTAKKQYVVAADLPRTISIPSVGVNNARVLRLSLTKDGAVQAPAGIWDTGWYDGSAKPGEAGNAFIDGHVSGPTMPAVFKDLKNIKKGAEITVERGDGSKLKYEVTSVTTQKLEAIDMGKVLAGPGGETLTIMTCGGNYQGNYTYDGRVIVVAKRV